MKHCLLAAAFLAVASPAAADENWYFIRVNCLPEIRYVGLTRLHTQNMPHDKKWLSDPGVPTHRLERALAAHGIYSPGMLVGRPLRCVIPASTADAHAGPRRAFVVEVSGDGELAKIAADGHQVGRISLGDGNGWKHTRSLTIRDDGVGILLETCTEEDISCRKIYLSEGK